MRFGGLIGKWLHAHGNSIEGNNGNERPDTVIHTFPFLELFYLKEYRFASRKSSGHIEQWTFIEIEPIKHHAAGEIVQYVVSDLEN